MQDFPSRAWNAWSFSRLLGLWPINLTKMKWPLSHTFAFCCCLRINFYFVLLILLENKPLLTQDSGLKTHCTFSLSISTDNNGIWPLNREDTMCHVFFDKKVLVCCKISLTPCFCKTLQISYVHGRNHVCDRAIFQQFF